jgi:hypothetical protein
VIPANHRLLLVVIQLTADLVVTSLVVFVLAVVVIIAALGPATFAPASALVVARAKSTAGTKAAEAAAKRRRSRRESTLLQSARRHARAKPARSETAGTGGGPARPVAVATITFTPLAIPRTIAIARAVIIAVSSFLARAVTFTAVSFASIVARLRTARWGMHLPKGLQFAEYLIEFALQPL